VDNGQSFQRSTYVLTSIYEYCFKT
jgi:hypothetical protein